MNYLQNLYLSNLNIDLVGGVPRECSCELIFIKLVVLVPTVVAAFNKQPDVRVVLHGGVLPDIP